MTTSNHGIDYGMGQTNVDASNGIRYGVIPLSSLHEWAIEGFDADYGEPTCSDCGNPLVEYNDDSHGDYPESTQCCDYACEECGVIVGSDHAYGEEAIGWTLDDGQYRAAMHGDDGDIFITRSLYYTHAGFCSPCAPGAGYLLSPTDEDGPKVYCFGPEFFEGDVAPYPVYRISNGERVA